MTHFVFVKTQAGGEATALDQIADADYRHEIHTGPCS